MILATGKSRKELLFNELCFKLSVTFCEVPSRIEWVEVILTVPELPPPFAESFCTEQLCSIKLSGWRKK